MLELVNISKEYEGVGEGAGTCVLKDVGLKIEDGCSAAIVGPSGSGKSTLLNIIGTLDRPTTGRVIFDGIDLSELNDNELAQIRNRQIGFVFQLHHLLPQCTVLENVLVPTLALRKVINRQELTDRAVSLLERIGLKDKLYHRPPELSAGQRQRAAIVRALINSPKLLLADEPTGSLDPQASEAIAELLAELNRTDRLTMVVVTHSTRLANRMDRTLELGDSQLAEGKNRK